MSKKIEEKYKEMSEREHILARPGMWVGSVKPEEKDLFIYNIDTAKMQNKTIEYIPAMLKVVDEVISNSCDEFRRKDNMGLTQLFVSINKKKGRIVVRDNGGIPIVKHKEAGVYVPEFIFGRLRTSSNYDDTEDRSVVGTNGVGSSLTNVFSKYFEVESADKKNKFHRSWSNNMETVNDDLKIEKCTDHFTQTTFDLDFTRFETEDNTFTDDFIDVIHKRCIDAAAANIGLKVVFKCDDYEETWKFKKFDEYIELYSDLLENVNDKIQFDNQLASVYVFPGSNIDVAFVNGAECSKGTHIRAVRNEVNNTVAEFLLKKDKIEVTTRAVDGKYAVFMNINVSNPAYDSQTKDTLTTPIDRFSKDEKAVWTIPERFLTQITKSEIIELMRDWFKQKTAAEDQKTLRKLNADAKKELKRPDKYVPANSKHKAERELWIYEGDSAATGFRVARNPQTQGAYLMRGVPLNCLNMTGVQIMKNEVFGDIVSVLGLEWGKDFDIKKLNYGKIVIATDGDVDGDKIAALLLLFFNNWPELIENHIVCRSMSPILIASKGKQKEVFYKLDDYRAKQKELKTWSIKYTKGLGGLSPAEYKDMMQNPKFMYFHLDHTADTMFRKWFGKDADVRKELMTDVLQRENDDEE